MRREQALAGRSRGGSVVAACLVTAALAAGEVDYPAVTSAGRVELPADHGAHPEFRTEWWYATGWLDVADGESLGFQVTFFRTRPDVAPDNPSAFAPHQLIIAHAALSDPAVGHLLHDQRIARVSHGLAGAEVTGTRVWLEDWRLERRGDAYLATIPADGFSLQLELRTTQPPMLNGQEGYSRKGGQPASASYYYSLPQLAVTGTVTRSGRPVPVVGTAWLDHEWSTALLDETAAGWDWIGINLDDGGALMAFRMRDLDGQALWAAATHRAPDGATRHFEPGEVEFVPGRRWRSPRTGISYPVRFRVRVGTMAYDIEPLFDDQESDSRRTTGAVYWEGAVHAVEGGQRAGRGYLELTGYGDRLRLPGG